ncbi:MAG: hypothetical protein HGA80_01390 [Candidatus Omnitrophica bacterium]|nr:hypothetical protein [Candidatus Omnitrophota bacterium]
MKCDKCAKKATVHLTEIIDGKVIEMHLCEDCAREQGQGMEQQFGLADLLAGLTDFGKHVPEVASKTAMQCPSCGLTYEDFRKFGRFGCAQCYLAFKPHLKVLLKKIHGSSNHLGKKPANQVMIQPVAEAAPDQPQPVVPEVETVETLRVKLQEAIEREDFESAARIRDHIHELEKRN